MKHIISLANTRNVPVCEIIDTLRLIAIKTDSNMHNLKIYLNALQEAIDCDFLDHKYDYQGEYYIQKQLDTTQDDCR